MTPLNNIAPINKINIEIIDPRKTATKFIWPFIFSTKLSLYINLVPQFLQYTASALLS
jgi:hypothetical protein